MGSDVERFRQPKKQFVDKGFVKTMCPFQIISSHSNPRASRKEKKRGKQEERKLPCSLAPCLAFRTSICFPNPSFSFSHRSQLQVSIVRDACHGSVLMFRRASREQLYRLVFVCPIPKSLEAFAGASSRISLFAYPFPLILNLFSRLPPREDLPSSHGRKPIEVDSPTLRCEALS